MYSLFDKIISTVLLDVTKIYHIFLYCYHSRAQGGVTVPRSSEIYTKFVRGAPITDVIFNKIHIINPPLSKR